MTRDRRLEKLTREGIELMRRERELALAANFNGLDELNAEKAAYLEKLDGLRAENEAGGPLPLQAERRRELETLFEILRRRAEENAALLRAAENGVKSARRRLQAIFEQKENEVGYTASGDKIDSKSRVTTTSEVL